MITDKIGDTAEDEDMFDKACHDWESVIQVARLGGDHSTHVKNDNVSFDNAIEILRMGDYDSVKGKIRSNVHRFKLLTIFHYFLGPQKLNSALIVERDLVFCLGVTPFEDENELHLNILKTIYCCLTNSKVNCSRYGNHWEDIGFQGNNPATDLRGVGILGLVHLLYSVTDPSTASLVKEIFKLSKNETQDFPFAVMGLNMTKIVLMALREGTLNKHCNKENDVLKVVCRFYVSLYFRLFRIWKLEGKTILNTCAVLQQLQENIKKESEVTAMMKTLTQHLNEQKTILFNTNNSNTKHDSNVILGSEDANLVFDGIPDKI